MMHYRARDLAEMAVNRQDELWALPDGAVEVEFDPLPDGKPSILTTTIRLTIFSAMMWRLYVEYPKTPAKIEHHIRNDRYTNKTHMTLLNRVLWDCYDAYQGEVDIEYLSLLAYQSYNAWYNRCVSTPRIEVEVSTISIEDLVDVVEEPGIAAAIDQIDEMNGSPLALSGAERVAERVLKDRDSLIGNPVKAMINSKPGSLAQIKQCLIARGPVTDLDSRYFPESIPSSFLSGMNSLIESMQESCTTKKALAFKEKPIEDAEYFNRRLQLLAAVVEGVEYICQHTANQTHQLLPGDCGTTHTLRWLVGKKDLKAIQGKYYYTEDGQLAVVHETDTFLIGKVIRMRAVSLCRHEKAQSCCAVCYGEIATSLPRGTNLGQVAAVNYGEGVTQSMLAIKHVDVASGGNTIEMSPYEQAFLEVIPDTRQVRFKASLKKKLISLSISPEAAQNLTELQLEDDIDRIPVSRITEVTDFFLTSKTKSGDIVTDQMRVDFGGKSSHFSHAFLHYIKDQGYTLSDSGRYLIDLSKFDLAQPVLDVPHKDENILDYLNSIIQFISSSAESVKRAQADGSTKMLRFCKTMEEALMAMFELSSVKLNVNIVHLEVIIYACMVRSLEQQDYRLPQAGNALQFGQLANLIGSRSLSAALAFEKNSALLLDPATYVNHFRIDHPLDDLVVPRNSMNRG